MPASPVLLTIDAATRLGWAAGPVGAQPPLLEWGAREFGGKGQTNGEIISTFRSWLNQRCYDLRPSLVVFESPFVPVPRAGFAKPGKSGPPPMNPLTLRRLLGMAAQIEAICFELRIDVRECTSQEFTKFMTGRGRFPGGRTEKKAEIIKACRHFGCEVGKDDNSADALGLFFYAEAIVSPRAAEDRRRLAADRDRALNGAGPLFSNPETENAPQAAILRGVVQPQGNAENPWSKMPTNI